MLLAVISQSHVTDIYTTQLDSDEKDSDLALLGAERAWNNGCWHENCVNNLLTGKKTCGINIPIPSCTCGVVINGFIQRKRKRTKIKERRGVNTAMQSQLDIKTVNTEKDSHFPILLLHMERLQSLSGEIKFPASLNVAKCHKAAE